MANACVTSATGWISVTVQGRGSLPSILRQAGADDADMLVAVTSSDETNMVACQSCHHLFRTPTKIARVREAAYLTRNELFDNEAIRWMC